MGYYEIFLMQKQDLQASENTANHFKKKNNSSVHSQNGKISISKPKS